MYNLNVAIGFFFFKLFIITFSVCFGLTGFFACVFLSLKTIEYNTSIVGYFKIALSKSARIHCISGQWSMFLPNMMEQCMTLAILFRTVGTAVAWRYIHTFVSNVPYYMLLSHIISSADIAIIASIGRILIIACVSVYVKFKHKIYAKKEEKRKFKTETMEKKEEGERDPYNQYE